MHLLVLSAFRLGARRRDRRRRRLNAPFGAQCFPTEEGPGGDAAGGVSMHLLVLSAFRPARSAARTLGIESQCTFWCSVLSDLGIKRKIDAWLTSQCTFWCSVLSDLPITLIACGTFGLNAPFGAQCFPTGSFRCSCLSRWGLNAPFGAQCFPTSATSRSRSTVTRSQCTFWCSVLSDLITSRFMPRVPPCLNAPFGAQCFPT